MTGKADVLGSDLAKVDATTEEDIARHMLEDDTPEWTDEMFDRAEHRIGDKVVRRGRPPLDTPKQQITLRLDQDVIDHFRATRRRLAVAYQCRAARGDRANGVRLRPGRPPGYPSENWVPCGGADGPSAHKRTPLSPLFFPSPAIPGRIIFFGIRRYSARSVPSPAGAGRCGSGRRSGAPPSSRPSI